MNVFIVNAERERVQYNANLTNIETKKNTIPKNDIYQSIQRHIQNARLSAKRRGQTCHQIKNEITGNTSTA